MIKQFVQRFMDKESEIRGQLAVKHPANYEELVRLVIDKIRHGDVYGEPDPNRIHVIDDGDYQGTLLFVIAADGYQPSDYWYVMVRYGSCSGCDTLRAISEYSSEAPTGEQVQDYWTLCLHIIQGLKKMGDESCE